MERYMSNGCQYNYNLSQISHYLKSPQKSISTEAGKEEKRMFDDSESLTKYLLYYSIWRVLWITVWALGAENNAVNISTIADIPLTQF